MALLAAQDLGEFMQRVVRPSSAVQAIRVAEGWLLSATLITPWPGEGDPPVAVPKDVYAWALELAAIAYDNPTALASRSVADVARAWDRERAQAILAAAGGKYPPAGTPDSGGRGPLGCFPPAPCLPDPPAVRWW